jgi:hypothetical protein
MEFWTAQLELAQQHMAEIEEKISQQRQKVRELRTQGLDTSVNVRLLAVMEESLARARAHAVYIEERIAVLGNERGWRRRGAAARQSFARRQRLGAD